MGATITIRNLSDATQRTLKHQAVDNGRSFEAELRAILDAAARSSGPAATDDVDALLAAFAQFREAARDTGFIVPERMPERPREVFA